MRFRQVLVSLFPLWVFAFFFKFGGGLHYTLLPTFGEQIFPLWLIGLLIGGSALIQLVLDVPAGYLLDRFGYVKLLILGTSCFAFGALFFVFGLHPWTYLINLVTSAIGWLFFSPGVDAYVLTKAPKAFAGRFMAMRDTVMASGIVVAMSVLILVVHASPMIIGILIATLLGLAILALCFIPSERLSTSAQKKISYQALNIRQHFFHDLFKILKKLNPASSLLLLSGFSGATFYGIIWFVVPILIARTQQGSGTLSLGLAVFDLSIVVTGYLLGRLTDHWSKRWLVFWGLLLFAVMGLFLGFHFGALFLVFGFLSTTGDEMASISLWAWIAHLDEDHEHDALLSGAISLTQDIGWMIGPIIAGFLFQYFGPSWTIATGACLIFLTWVIASFVMHRFPQPPSLISLPIHKPRRRRHTR